MGHETPSTGLISDTVRAQEAYNQKKSNKSNIKCEVIWKIDNKKSVADKNPQVQQAPQKLTDFKNTQKPGYSRSRKLCYNGGSEETSERHTHAASNVVTLRKTQTIRAK